MELGAGVFPVKPVTGLRPAELDLAKANEPGRRNSREAPRVRDGRSSEFERAGYRPKRLFALLMALAGRGAALGTCGAAGTVGALFTVGASAM